MFITGIQQSDSVIYIFLFSCWAVSDSVTPWTAACQAYLSITISQSLFRLMSTELAMPSNHLISSSVVPFSSCLQSFPASGSFLMSRLFALGRQSIGASASFLPVNFQDWFPLELTGPKGFQTQESEICLT